MTFDPTLIFSVRKLLNDMPVDYISDDIIYQILQQADRWLEQVLDPPDDVYRNHCLVITAAYFAYETYLIGLERAAGTAVTPSTFTVEELRRLVYLLIKPYAKLPLKPDLTVDDEQLSSAPVVIDLTSSNLS